MRLNQNFGVPLGPIETQYSEPLIGNGVFIFVMYKCQYRKLTSPQSAMPIIGLFSSFANIVGYEIMKAKIVLLIHKVIS